jgi:hypothetical protein
MAINKAASRRAFFLSLYLNDKNKDAPENQHWDMSANTYVANDCDEDYHWDD